MLDDGNQYLYGAGLSAMKQGSAWSYYLADGPGSTMAVVDASGTVQKSYQYDVYGEVTGGSGSLANEFDFAGQQTDETGLQYLRARYYDPVSGVFLSRDPLASLASWLGNPHGYAYADPVGLSDPTGLCGYFGDPNDPWCREQTHPRDNVNDSWKKPEADRDPRLQFVVDGMKKLVEEYGEARHREAEGYQSLGTLVADFLIRGNEQLVTCARDIVCQNAVPIAIIGAFLVAGVFQPEVLVAGGALERVLAAWTAYVAAVQYHDSQKEQPIDVAQ